MIWWTLSLIFLGMVAMFGVMLSGSKVLYGLGIMFMLAAWATTFGVQA